jgi:hypothetical protein
MTDQTTGPDAALLSLDPQGGWDHDRGWGEHVHRSIRTAIDMDLVEHGVSFDICHWRLTDAGIKRRRGMDEMGAKAIAYGDPARDAGWLVSTPWLGRKAAVFGLTKEDAIAQAERGRRAHVAELHALVDRWSRYQLQAEFVEAVSGE